MRIRFVTLLVVTMIVGLFQLGDSTGPAIARDKPYVPAAQKYERLPHTEVNSTWNRPKRPGKPRTLRERGPLPKDWAVVQTAEPSKPSHFEKVPQTGAWTGSPLAALTGIGKKASDLDGKYRIGLVDPDVAAKLGSNGLVFEIVAAPDADTDARFTLNYSALVELAGSDWASRLQLATLPACALTTPGKAACQQETPLADSQNHHADEQVTATLKSLETGDVTTDRSSTDTSRTATTATLVAATAGPGGSQGTYLASDLKASGSWSQGGASGSFNWSYPITVTPPASGDVAPGVALSYSSAAIDGMNSNSNPQGSWTGLGFDYQPGYIERTFRNCKEATPSSTDKGLCWAGDILTMHLPGGGTQALVVDSETGKIRPEGDTGERIERLTGAPNGGVNGEYWRVTTTDGTQYTFGANVLPGGTTTNATKSAWNVTVHGGTAADGCASKRCVRTWRWNLDMVEDVHHNVAAYYYAKETNYFIPSGTTTRVAYDRAGYLSRIDYGIKKASGSIYGVANPPNRVSFTVEERCNPTGTITCTDAQFTNANRLNWPDVPVDQNCTSTSTCNINWPTFWTRKRLAKIATSYYNGSAYATVDSYALNYVWSQSSSTPALDLYKITRTATAGGQTATLPPVTFSYATLDSRVKGYKSLPDMAYDRLTRIVSETGASTAISYSSMYAAYNDNFAPLCTQSSVPANPDNNTMECYPVNWTQPFQTTPTLDYFHKYVVVEVLEADALALTPTRRTEYKYSEPGWHFDDNEVIKPAQRTWSQWRGYRKVETLTGAPGVTSANGTQDQQTRSVATYYLGMHEDRNADGTTPAVKFKDSQAAERTDNDEYAGMLAETRTFDGDTEISSTRTFPTTLATTATRTRSGLTALRAHVVATTKKIETTQGSGASTTDLTKTTLTKHDEASAAEPFLQRPTSVKTSATGGTGDTTQSCVVTSYADNATTWVRSAPAEVTVFSDPTDADGGCTGTKLVSRTRTYYDTKTDLGGSNVTSGDATRVDRAVTEGGSPRYATTTAGYDPLGRVTSTTVYPDGIGSASTARTTTTAYVIGTGGQTTVTTTLPPVTGITGDVTTKQIIEPARGVVTSSTDLAGRTTTATFDALGRYTAVWNPGRAQATQTASITYAYQFAAGQPLAVTTKTLIDVGNGTTPGYDTSIQILDTRGILRQTQSTSPTGGRAITDNFVDSHGWTVATNDRWYTAGAPSTNVVTTAQDGIDSRTTTIYDGVGRPTKVQGWRGDNPQPLRTTTTIYGGDRTTVIPPAGAIATTTLVNALGQTAELRRYTEPVTPSTFASAANNKTTYTYTPAGAIETMTTAAGTDKAATWANTYDLLGRQIGADDPDSGISSTTYDDTGAVTSATDGADHTVSTTYDAWGRPRARFAGVPSTGTKLADWTYDSLVRGELTSSRSYVKDEATGDTRTYTNTITGYNELGLPTGTDLALDVPDLRATYSTRATYTSTGLPATTTLAETRSATLNQGSYIERLRHWYTPLGLENGLTGTNVYLQNATYTPYREASQYVLGVNDATSALTYTRDPHHRWITNTQLTGQLAQPQIANVAATYDAVGNTTKTVDTQGGPGAPTRTTCYQYDSLRQLTNAWTATDNCAGDPSDSVVGGPDPFWQTWSYDAAGSRESQTIHTLPGQSGEDATTTYNNGIDGHEHALTSTETTGETSPSAIGVITQLPPTSTATYTPNGATDTITTPEGDTNFKYRDDGSLATITTADGATSEFVNDAEGNRILRIDRNDGTTSTTLYLPGQQVRVTDSGGSKTLTTHRYYTLASGQQIAVRKNDVNPVFTLTDPHGTAQLTYDPFSNSTNPPVERRALDPYGNKLGSDSTPAPWIDDRTFLGKPHNPATGLVDLAARQYDPATGRFTSVDPLLNLADATQANGYNYANNNPITYTDPDGLAATCVREGTCHYVPNPKGGAPIVTGPKSSSATTSTEGRDEGTTTISLNLDLLRRHKIIEDKSGNWLTSFGAGVAETTLWMGENLTPMAPIADIAGLAGAPLPSDIWSNEMEARGVKGSAYTIGTIVGPPLLGLGGAALRLPRVLSKIPFPGTAARACSFIGATTVLMADGSRQPIKDVRPGDKVIATDPETGEQLSKTVEHVFVHDDIVIDLVVDRDVITTTEDHPFWSVTDQRFERADELSPGEEVLGADGREVTVSGLKVGTKVKALTYNLEVESIHTYHVGDAGILVHNACSRALGKALESAGFVRLAGEHAHHIVPGAHRGAGPARRVLQRFGIDIDSANNGAFLPGYGSTPNPRGALPHLGATNSTAYIDAVNSRLLGVTSRTGALRELASIRYDLLAGRMP